MKYFVTLLVILALGFTQNQKESWKPLFNGRNLEGWDTWLAPPHASYGVPQNKGEWQGLNNDPLNVFSVTNIDGAPAIRISGQGFGAITTKTEYENFHLSLEYKWGEAKWAPRENDKRDSGILYYCVGEHGAGSEAWMRSQECQVQEGDTGDYWSVAGAIADIRSRQVVINNKTYRQFAFDGTPESIGYGFDGNNWDVLRVTKSSMQEKSNDEWNRVEVYAYNGKSVHVVNGKTVMVLENSRHIVNGKEEPLTKGKIQIQTEGAAVYYRNIRIRGISKIPHGVLKCLPRNHYIVPLRSPSQSN